MVCTFVLGIENAGLSYHADDVTPPVASVRLLGACSMSLNEYRFLLRSFLGLLNIGYYRVHFRSFLVQFLRRFIFLQFAFCIFMFL